MNDRHLISEHYKLVTELTDSKANVQRLIKKYGVSEDEAHVLIQRFTKVEARLQNLDISSYPPPDLELISAPKDIFSYPSLDRLKHILTELENTSSNKQQLKRDAELGAKIVFENENVIVRLIRNKRAAIKFGRGTNWCIAVDDYDFEPREQEDNEEGEVQWDDDNEDTGNRFNGYTVDSVDENTVYYVERKKPDRDTYDRIAILINIKDEETEMRDAMNNNINDHWDRFVYSGWDFAKDNNIPREVFKHVAYTGEERETIQRIRQEEMDEWMRKEWNRKK